MQRVLEDRVALARKLHNEPQIGGHRLMAKSWAEKEHEFLREMKVIRDAMQRIERVAQDARGAKLAAE